MNKEILIKELINDVEMNCRHLSDLNYISEYPNYKKIIEMDEYAIPFILQRIDNTAIWFVALEKITGLTKEIRSSKINLIRESWKKWAKENGY